MERYLKSEDNELSEPLLGDGGQQAERLEAHRKDTHSSIGAHRKDTIVVLGNQAVFPSSSSKVLD